MKTVESLTPDYSSAEAFSEVAELIGDKIEFDMICRLLKMPENKITRERVLDEVMSLGMDWGAVDKLNSGFEKVGFPEEGEPVEVTLLTPKEIEAILRTGYDGHGVFNNEFVLFAYAQGKGPEDAPEPESILAGSILDTVAQFNPVRQRLRALTPGLVSALEEYGAQHLRMSGFYGGLVEDGMPALNYMTLFTIADQLMQRLVRPGDKQYMSECMSRWVEAPSKSIDAPKYDELELEQKNIVSDARRYLYT